MNKKVAISSFCKSNCHLFFPLFQSGNKLFTSAYHLPLKLYFYHCFFIHDDARIASRFNIVNAIHINAVKKHVPFFIQQDHTRISIAGQLLERSRDPIPVHLGVSKTIDRKSVV